MNMWLARSRVPVRHIFLIDTPRKMPPGSLARLADEQEEVAARRLVQRPELARYYAGGPATLRANVNAIASARSVRHRVSATLLVSEEWRPIIIDKELGWQGWLPAGTRMRTVAKTRAELIGKGVTRIAAIISEFSDRCHEPDRA